MVVHYDACNITEHDQLGGGSMIAWEGIFLESCTDPSVTSTLTAVRVTALVQWGVDLPGAGQCLAPCSQSVKAVPGRH